ncbi:GNAT family N-acetyltransferase [Streptomyces sp. GC420]|uniref:GNAT family N-acetyltransferase n=1 Tax=Streptomyces sp. GC420 TaxID=2697568 RepID=UPI001414D22F|nr:GNAT family N-acetyltransferase [Streptomyces sp. GC420]NBM15624.1 GNAT family N-acetyltransferase [Streptomyces sp. GC420]
MGVRIRRAGESDRRTVVGILDEAFMYDPVSSWLFPDEAHRRVAHGAFLEAAFLDDALGESGFVHITEDTSAVALWRNVPADAPHEVPEGDDRGSLIARLTGELHPRGREHKYLMMIAVAPGRQREGIGTALISTVLEDCDREGVAAYLEASSARSRDLYVRLGFEFLGRTVELPDGPRMWPMWREPVPSARG